MNYKFKIAQEIAWAAAIGAGVFTLQLLSDFNPDTITDWTTWFIAGGAGALRAAAAAALPTFIRLTKSLVGSDPGL